MKKTIAVLPGDGIGPEVMAQACKVLQGVGEHFGHDFLFREAFIGGAAFERFGKHCPEETLETCRGSDAILFGSVGGPVREAHLDKWRGCEANSILTLRKTFQFNVNLRPVRVFPELAGVSPLREQALAKGVDLLIVRELLGDVYFGEHATFEENGRRVAQDTSRYTEDQIAAVAHTAFQAARNRRRKVTSVDKANVMDTSRLWRKVVREVSAHYQDVLLEDMLVDNCAMQLIMQPAQFDVILTSNMFGDILSDEAAVLSGSLGLLASASLNQHAFGLFEPPGGSAPDIAGKDAANPLGQILSGALLLRHAFGMLSEAACIEQAVQDVLRSGLRTADIAGTTAASTVGTSAMGSAVAERVQK